MGYRNPAEGEIFWDEPAPIVLPRFVPSEPAPEAVPVEEPAEVPVPA